MDEMKVQLCLPRWIEEERAAEAAKRREVLERHRLEEHARRRQGIPVREETSVPESCTSRRRRRGQVRLFDPREVENFRAELVRHHSDSSDRDRAKATICRMSKLGSWRTPLRLSKAIQAKMARVRAEMPNFAQVLDFLEATLGLCARSPAVLPPIVLDGPPGIGKTHFAAELAAALGVPFRRVDVAAAQAVFALVGTDKGYANSQTGAVFEELAFSESCSPMLLLDELDKAGEGDSRFPLMGALYGLLEPCTARDFRDASFPQIRLEARHVVWLATSNAAERIPEPIRNRCRTFSIEAPAPDAMRAVLRRMAVSIWKGTGRREPAPALSDVIVDRLATLPTRTAKLAIAEAFGRAVLDGRSELALHDLPAAPTKTRKVGFL